MAIAAIGVNDGLAMRVRAAFLEFDSLRRRTITAGVTLGTTLLEAKAQLGHGNWLDWLDDVGVPERTARRCMQLAAADGRGELADLPADSPASAALQVIAGRRRLEPKAQPAQALAVGRPRQQVRFFV